jgi:hypothetical protein
VLPTARSKLAEASHKKANDRRTMIYLVTYKKKTEILQLDCRLKRLMFIEAKDGLTLEKAIALLKNLTEDEVEDSSVQIIGQKDWDPAKINTPGIRFHKLD